jgi:hypothetical protein
MGTPVLLFYHRAFFYLAGALSVLGLGLKASVVTTLGIFFVIGAYGMRQVLALVTTSRLLCVVGSIGFLFTNYVFTDWLVPRGDPAEFSALMIVPWLIYWCLGLVKLHRFSYLIIPIMVVLVNAHSAIALTSLFLLAIAFAVFVASSGVPALRAVAKRLVLSIACTSVLLAPLLIAEFRFSQVYDPATKNISGYNASSQFVSIGRYLYDGRYQWFSLLQTPPGFNFVQIDFAIWIPIAAAIILLVIRLCRRRVGGIARSGLRSPESAVVVFVAGSFACYLFLQLKISYFVYRVLTPLQVINFPWRMLAYITPLGIILVVIIADRATRRISIRWIWYVLAVLWLASLVALSPIPLSQSQDDIITPTKLSPLALFTAPKSVDYRTFEGFFNTYGFPKGPLYEAFLPKVVTASGNEIGAMIPLYGRLHSHDAGAQSLSTVPCTVVGPSHAAFETLSLTFAVHCEGKTLLALPISYNSFSTVLVEGGTGTQRQIPYFRRATDPRVIIEVPGSMRETVIVHLPTLWGTLFS